MSEPFQNPLRVTSSCHQQCWVPAVWHVYPKPLWGFSASLEWRLLERRLWTVWATDEISSTLQILQGGIWEEYFFSPALTSWLITQEILFFFSQRDCPCFWLLWTRCLKFIFLWSMFHNVSEDESAPIHNRWKPPLEWQLQVFVFLKNYLSEGGNLRNYIMPGENISDGFFSKMIKIGKIWKRKQRINPGKGSCLKRTSAVTKAISERVLVQIWEPQMAVRGSFQKLNYFQCFVFMSVKWSIHRAYKPDHGSEDSTSHVVWWGLCSRKLYRTLFV